METKPKILVIDDEQIVCESCRRILSGENYNVDTLTNPQEAYHQTLKNDYDLVLLDLRIGDTDGLDLLADIRKTKPDIPVMVITGYPCNESKKQSNALGVLYYILKPFHPKEIIGPVKSILEKKIKDNTEVLLKTEIRQDASVKKWKNKEKFYHFFKTGWLQQGIDGTVRIGGYLTSMPNESVNSIKLPKVYDTVYRGLPLAKIYLNNGTKQIIPSAVTGKIIEVNAELNKNLSLLENKIQEKFWIARIIPDNIEEDLALSEKRSVILFSSDKNSLNFEQLNNLGCIVHVADSLNETISILDKEYTKVVLLDAESFPSLGFSFVKILNNLFPDLKIMVFNEPNPELEILYRKNNIYYYAVKPVPNTEISDLLNSVFYISRQKNIVNTKSSSFLPESVNKIEIKNKQGKNVVILAFDDTLHFNEGIGNIIISNLLEKAYPIKVMHTRTIENLHDASGIKRITKEKENADGIIILHSVNLNRIEGSIVKNYKKYENNNSTENQLITITIQPNSDNVCKSNFDMITMQGIAELIEKEIEMI